MTTPVTLDQVRSQLGMDVLPAQGRTGSNVTDATLQPYLDAALAICADRCGPVVESDPITETHDGGLISIVTRQTPIANVTSITEYVGNSTYLLTEQPLGQSVDNYAYTIDDAISGVIIRRGQAGTPIPFVSLPRCVVVVYTAGFATLPADLANGLLILTQHLYASRVATGGQRPGGTSAGTPSTYAVPNRVMELWKPYLRVPGLA
jgi:hypothetical protein